MDSNGDGERDYVEPGLSGVTVYLDTHNFGQLDPDEQYTVTDQYGLYTFSGLGAGTYHVRQVVPSGFVQTFPGGGGEQTVVLGASEDKYGVNFGDNYAALVAVNDSAVTDEDVPMTIDILANDNKPAGYSDLWFCRCYPEHGRANWNGSALVYTPNANWNGVDTFNYVVTLGGGLYFKAEVQVTVNPVNDLPVIPTTEFKMTGASLSGVLALDADHDTMTHTVSGVEHGQLDINGDGTFTYTPTPPGWHGVERFSVEFSDGQASSGPTDVAIYVCDTLHTKTDIEGLQILTGQQASGTYLGGVVIADLEHSQKPDIGGVAIQGDMLIAGSSASSTNPVVLIAKETDQVLHAPSSTRWEPVAEILGPKDMAFGSAVAISGNTAVIGACLDDVGVPNDDAGAVYVYRDTGNGWAQVARLTAPTPVTRQLFGSSVAIDQDGDTIVVGAPGTYTWPILAGKAYVFQLTGSTWTYAATLQPPSAKSGDAFGCSVDISGDRIIVGGYNLDGGASSTGAAYIFQRVSGAWTRTQKLIASDGAENDFFGCSVAIDGTSALVGANGDDYGGMIDAGAAYLFELNGQNPQTESTKITVTGTPDDSWGFGAAVDLHGDDILIGAPDQGTDFQGGVYLLDKTEAGAQTWQADPLCVGSTNKEVVGASIALGERGAVVGRPKYDSNRGAAYVYAYDRTPVVEDLAFDVTGSSLSDNLFGIDPFEGEPLTFSVVAQPPTGYGSVVVNSDGSFTYTPGGAPQPYATTFTYKAVETSDNTVHSNTGTVSLHVGPPAEIVDRRVFYDGSCKDQEKGPDPQDDNARDTYVDAWVVTEEYDPATHQYVTGHSEGINGIMIDVDNLPHPVGITADDFTFAYGTEGNWTEWQDDPESPVLSVTVHTAEGHDRITLIWPDRTFLNTWLKVTVLNTLHTGLEEPDVFCFGSFSGDANGDGVVGAGDLDILRSHWGQSDKFVYEGNIDMTGFVGAADLDWVRAHWGQYLADPIGGDKMMGGSGGTGELYTSSWSKEVDEIFFYYGFGDDDPTNDLTRGDKLWDQFVDDLFTTIRAALDKELAETAAIAG